MLVYRSICEAEKELLNQNIIVGSPTPMDEGLGYSDPDPYDNTIDYKYFFLFAEDAFAFRNINAKHHYVVQYDIPREILKNHLDFGNYTIVNLHLVKEEEEFEDNIDYEDFFTDKYEECYVYSVLPEFKVPISELDTNYINAIYEEDKMPLTWRNDELHTDYIEFMLSHSYYHTVQEHLKTKEVLTQDIIDEVFYLMDMVEARIRKAYK